VILGDTDNTPYGGAPGPRAALVSVERPRFKPPRYCARTSSTCAAVLQSTPGELDIVTMDRAKMTMRASRSNRAAAYHRRIHDAIVDDVEFPWRRLQDAAATSRMFLRSTLAA